LFGAGDKGVMSRSTTAHGHLVCDEDRRSRRSSLATAC
jgi:hypothetical protein